MADQGFDQTPNSTLTKLLEVDSELADQEAELLSQLALVQEKRKSLTTVISMFTKVDTSATALEIQTPPAETSKVNTPATAPVEQGKKQKAPVVAALPLETSAATATAESETEAVTDTQSKVAKKTLSSPTRTNKNTKFRQTTKSPKRSSGWQDYMREEFSGNSLPEAVHTVLQRGAERVFEIPAIVKAIFVEQLPMDVGSKARRQVTNILSEGARKNKWYRGQIGYYSVSRTAADNAKYL